MEVWLNPADGEARVMRLHPREKSPYLDGDWGEETGLTKQFLIQPGEELEYVKAKGGFYQCKWNGIYGWLRTESISFKRPSSAGPLLKDWVAGPTVSELGEGERKRRRGTQ
jgi:hypothetical protein